MADSTFMNTPELPFVSAIIPFYNSEPTLSICLESVQRIDYPREKLEVILVDNGSSDGGMEIAKKFDLTVLRETSIKSAYAARNKGIKEARGELIAFTDSDCIVTKDWLKRLVTEWKDATIGCFAGEIKAYQPRTIVEAFSDRELILRQNRTLACPYLPYAQTANVAYRKEVFEKIGLFAPEMVSGGDADMSWRMQRELGLKIKYMPEAIVFHKHRADIKGLYKQFHKYELGEMLWRTKYNDYALPSTRTRWDELLRCLMWTIIRFPDNLKKYAKRQIDIVDLATPFLRIVICLGKLTARLQYMKLLKESSSSAP